jgi:hypothetical protein
MKGVFTKIMAFKSAVSNETRERNKKPDIGQYTITTAPTRGAGLSLIFSPQLAELIVNHWPKNLDKSFDVLFDPDNNRVRLVIDSGDSKEFKKFNNTKSVCAHSFTELGMKSFQTYRAISTASGDGVNDSSMSITFALVQD